MEMLTRPLDLTTNAPDVLEGGSLGRSRVPTFELGLL